MPRACNSSRKHAGPTWGHLGAGALEAAVVSKCGRAPALWVSGLRAAPAWDLVALAGAGGPVADVQNGGERDPEPVPAGQPSTWCVEKHVDQGGKGQEDDAKERPQEGAEGGIDPLRPCNPQDEQRQTREDPGEDCKETTHLTLQSHPVAAPCSRYGVDGPRRASPDRRLPCCPARSGRYRSPRLPASAG